MDGSGQQHSSTSSDSFPTLRDICWMESRGVYLTDWNDLYKEKVKTVPVVNDAQHHIAGSIKRSAVASTPPPNPSNQYKDWDPRSKKRSTIPSTPPPHPDNPYSAWDPRHAPENSFLHEAKRRIIQEEIASITIQRWLTIRIFNRNFNRHLCRRSHNKSLCRGASSYAKKLASTGRIKSPAPAPSINQLPNIPTRKQPYPTMEETHAFRHRGLSLPILPPTKKKKRRKRYKRCIRPPPRNRKSSSTSSTASHLPTTSLCQVIHPTRGCKHCPAFFVHQKDLDTHHFLVHRDDFDNNQTRCLDKVTSTEETPPVPAVVIVPHQHPCPPPSTSAQSSSPTRSNPSTTTELERHQDRVTSSNEISPVSADDSKLPQKPKVLQHKPLSTLQHSPPISSIWNEHDLQHFASIMSVPKDFFAWGSTTHPD